MSDLHITDQNSDKSHFCILPNLLSRLDLNCYERSLYWALKEAAGENGSCTKSYKRLGKIAGMKETKLKKTLDSLSQINSIIKKPLIIVKKRIDENGSKSTHEIFIIDIWKENSLIKTIIGESCGDLGGSCDEVPPSPKTGGVPRDTGEPPSPKTDKEEPFKKNQIEEDKKEQKNKMLVASLLADFFSSLKNVYEKFDEKKLKPKKSDIEAMDQLLKVHDPETIRAVFLFCHADDFWKAHVHTVCYLKKKFDKINIQRISKSKVKNEKSSRPNSSGSNKSEPQFQGSRVLR